MSHFDADQLYALGHQGGGRYGQGCLDLITDCGL